MRVDMRLTRREAILTYRRNWEAAEADAWRIRRGGAPAEHVHTALLWAEHCRQVYLEHERLAAAEADAAEWASAAEALGKLGEL